jgi:hypothetical protein
MKLAQIRIVLHLKGPVLTEASTLGEPGLDSPFARNHEGNLYLPFSLVKGKLKEAWAELAGLPGVNLKSDLNKGFGGPPTSGSWDPNRGRLHFTDFLCKTPEVASGGKKKNSTTGIKRDPERKAAKEGAIQVMEKPFDAGREVLFEGVCWFFAKDDAEVTAIMADLGLLFSWLTSLGADRTVGFGEFLGANLGGEPNAMVVDIPAPDPQPEMPPADVMDLKFELLDPFCIAEKHLTKYLFEGSEIIPGGALKGTLASMVLEMLGKPGHALDDKLDNGAWGILGKNFESIRFTHAFPVGKNFDEKRTIPGFPGDRNRSRPNVLPLSLVKFGKKEGYEDVALHQGAFFPGSYENGQSCAPAFQIDWKGDSDVREAFHWPKRLKRDLRVRHEHDPRTRRAMDGPLFAYETVSPAEDVEWRTQVDLSRVNKADKPQVWACLKELLSLGFNGLGKTKARTGPVKCEASRSEGVEPKDGLFVVTLQTPAFLCDPIEAAKTSAFLFDLYKAVWSDLSKDSSGKPTLELVRFFARQSLEGGYLGQRFGAKRPYNPFFLTSAGSVFVLKPAGEMETQASELVTKWRDHGLPLPGWVENSYGNTWDTNPFLPENGYGEIAVNLNCHWDPKADELAGAKEAAHG